MVYKSRERMSYSRMDKQHELETLTPLLADLFEISRVLDYEFMQSGFMSQNYRVNTSIGSFFLKRYRDRINTVIHEIKFGEQFFADHGLPIILPIKDRYQREAFLFQGSWYSLFPFVHGTSPMREQMTDELLTSISTLLAKFHLIGSTFSYRPFQMIRIGNSRKFLMENVELDRWLSVKTSLTQAEAQIQELLVLKRRLFEATTMTPSDFHLSYDCLLHGDFQHCNLFTKNNEVTHVFDLERTALGPASYELVRAIFMDCFEDGWEEQNFTDARLYLNNYQTHCTISKQEFTEAIMYYFFNIIHTSWIETNYLIYGVEQSLAVLDRQKNRLLYLSTHDLRELSETIWT